MSRPARPGALPILGRDRWFATLRGGRRASRSQVLGGEPEGSPPGLEEGCKGRGHCQGARRGPGGFPSGLRAGFEDRRSLRFWLDPMLRWLTLCREASVFPSLPVVEATSCAMGGRVLRRLWPRGVEGFRPAVAPGCMQHAAACFSHRITGLQRGSAGTWTIGAAPLLGGAAHCGRP